MTVPETIEQIRKSIAECSAGERAILEALIIEEANRWVLRLDELDRQEEVEKHRMEGRE